MVLLKSFVLASLAAVATAKSAVLDLIPANFDKVVLKSGKPTLVEFFAPWCGHCKNLAPVYEELGLAFEYAKDKVQIAKVDADAERELGKKYGVQGFPTIKFFDGKSDKPIEYNGGRDFDSLANFITEKTGVRPRKKQAPPSHVVILNDSNFKQQIGGDKHVLVAFTAPWCGRMWILSCIGNLGPNTNNLLRLQEACSNMGDPRRELPVRDQHCHRQGGRRRADW